MLPHLSFVEQLAFQFIYMLKEVMNKRTGFHNHLAVEVPWNNIH